MSALPAQLTLLDVARASGYSKATVSKVAAGHVNVPAVTRERIERAAAKIGYRWRRDDPYAARRGPRAAPSVSISTQRRARPIGDLRLVDLHAAIMVESMPRDDVVQYELEGVLALADSGVASLADEDYDPAPVPTGCPGCWRSEHAYGSMEGVCLTCPSPPSKQDVRAARAGARGPLTPLERRVAEYAAAGLSYEEIADQLGVAPKTARGDRSRACVKLGVDRAGIASALAALDG